MSFALGTSIFEIGKVQTILANGKMLDSIRVILLNAETYKKKKSMQLNSP